MRTNSQAIRRTAQLQRLEQVAANRPQDVLGVLAFWMKNVPAKPIRR